MTNNTLMNSFYNIKYLCVDFRYKIIKISSNLLSVYWLSFENSLPCHFTFDINHLICFIFLQ
jgi:hypothetical protein